MKKYVVKPDSIVTVNGETDTHYLIKDKTHEAMFTKFDYMEVFIPKYQIGQEVYWQNEKIEIIKICIDNERISYSNEYDDYSEEFLSLTPPRISKEEALETLKRQYELFKKWAKEKNGLECLYSSDHDLLKKYIEENE